MWRIACQTNERYADRHAHGTLNRTANHARQTHARTWFTSLRHNLHQPSLSDERRTNKFCLVRKRHSKLGREPEVFTDGAVRDLVKVNKRWISFFCCGAMSRVEEEGRKHKKKSERINEIVIYTTSLGCVQLSSKRPHHRVAFKQRNTTPEPKTADNRRTTILSQR